VKAIRRDTRLYKYTLIRDLEAEAQLANELLGETVAQELAVISIIMKA
jgi:hypothetical protein